VQKGFELCYEKGRIQNYPKFRVVHFTVDEGNKVLTPNAPEISPHSEYTRDNRSPCPRRALPRIFWSA
jgi:hypothetical protein